MRKLIFTVALLFLSNLLYSQILIRDALTDREFTTQDSVRVAVTQSIVNRSKTVEYYDAQTFTVKTKTVANGSLNNCGYTDFMYSPSERIKLLDLPGCVDTESMNAKNVFHIRIEAKGYEAEEINIDERVSSSGFYYCHTRNNPLNKPNVIYLAK